LRSRAEDDLKAARIADALDLMSAHAQSDFPPQWEPPPRVGYGENSPDIFDVMQEVLDHDCAPWVRATFEDKFRRQMHAPWALQHCSRNQLATILRVLNQLPDGPDIAAQHHSAIKGWLSVPSLTAQDRENVDALLQLAEKGNPPDH
jgi:hypothetical protein